MHQILIILGKVVIGPFNLVKNKVSQTVSNYRWLKGSEDADQAKPPCVHLLSLILQVQWILSMAVVVVVKVVSIPPILLLLLLFVIKNIIILHHHQHSQLIFLIIDPLLQTVYFLNHYFQPIHSILLHFMIIHPFSIKNQDSPPPFSFSLSLFCMPSFFFIYAHTHLHTHMYIYFHICIHIKNKLVSFSIVHNTSYNRQHSLVFTGHKQHILNHPPFLIHDII